MENTEESYAGYSEEDLERVLSSEYLRNSQSLEENEIHMAIEREAGARSESASNYSQAQVDRELTRLCNHPDNPFHYKIDFILRLPPDMRREMLMPVIYCDVRNQYTRRNKG